MGRAIRLEREKQTGDLGEVLAERSTAALTQGCLQTNQKSFGIALDTADFVRHVPGFPGLITPATTMTITSK
jgi:hypothetical protein